MTEKTCNEEHWNDWYDSRKVEELGWYQEELGPSLDLLNRCGLDKDAHILDVGTGASSAFIDHISKEGYAFITATDLSKKALDIQQERLGLRAEAITWIQDDLTAPCYLKDLEPVMLWHDRAVLHFLNKPVERGSYKSIMDTLVERGGFVIIAAFSLEGADKCSMLPVYRYNEEMLVEFMGEGYELVHSLRYIYQMPSGDKRPYVYTLFQRRL